ncbi:MAG: type I 3-dehydroquinate dehydratase [Acidobacteria bacterium]|nr:type I 3-dehydroquinate dehydratase [Acidobacteriota bacterium]
MTSLLCETVTGRTMAELVAGRGAATAADMVELRLDGVADVDVARALHGRRVPAVVTCRPAWEGGRFTGGEEERRRLLAEALACGAEYVDIEWRAVRDAHDAGFRDLVRSEPSRAVVSVHDFAGVPDDIGAQARAMRGTGAAVVKVAITARRLSDTLPLVEIGRSSSAVVIGMGEAGVPSRLLASRFGSQWTYAGAAVAPGQMPARRMVEGFRFRSIGPGTALYGVVGDEVMRSTLPVMFNAAFAEGGIDAVCVPLRAADGDDLRAFTQALGFAGVVSDGASREEAERQFERWTGRTPAPDVMRETGHRAVERRL